MESEVAAEEIEELRELEGQTLPPEELLDEHNPLNDPYFRSLRAARAMVVSICSGMRHRQIQIAKMYHAGRSVQDIADATGVKTATVYRNLADRRVRRLLDALRAVLALTAGPNLEQRRNMLYRIARRCETAEPNTAIAALKELNKLEGSYPVPAPPQPAAIEITIGLPRTALDDTAAPSLPPPVEPRNVVPDAD